jgi:hypothetical protein
MKLALPKDKQNTWIDPVSGIERKLAGVDPEKELVEILPDGNMKLHPLPKVMGPTSVHGQLMYSEFQKATKGMDVAKAMQEYSKYVLEEMMPR